MFKLVISALATLALAISAEATCKKSTAGHNWDMIVYGSTGCTGTYEEFYGTVPFAPETDGGCKCFNIAAKLNDKVKSFSFTANGRSVNLFKDADCKGTLLGRLLSS
jgi:hypothetical protein